MRVKGPRNETTPSIGSRLRDARERLRLSQTAVAAFIGTNRQAVAAVERGQRAPDAIELMALSNLYRLTVEEILSGSHRGTAPLPSFRPRYNGLGELSDRDRDELAAFDQYLRSRPRHLEARPTTELPRLATIAERARAWANALGMEEVLPVPVFGIIARIGIEVRFTSLGKLAGAFIGANGDCPCGILINSDQPNERQRYTAAHELGHLALEHESSTGTFVNHLGRKFDPVELHADQFAAEILIPSYLLLEHTNRLPDEALELQVLRLASLFMVSFQAMSTRLAKLGAIGPRETKQLAQVKPAQLTRLAGHKKKARAHFKDVWIGEVINRYLPNRPEVVRTHEGVRLLQETVFADYARRTPETDRADDAAQVYATVARWVATTYPLIRS